MKIIQIVWLKYIWRVVIFKSIIRLKGNIVLEGLYNYGGHITLLDSPYLVVFFEPNEI
jgi:hypothetical protein